MNYVSHNIASISVCNEGCIVISISTVGTAPIIGSIIGTANVYHMSITWLPMASTCITS